MKHLKSFKINESKSPDGIMTLEYIKDFFDDILDLEWEIKEEKVDRPFIKKLDGDSYDTSILPKEGFDYLRKIIFSYNPSSSDNILNKLKKISNSQSVFYKSLERLNSAEDIEIIDFSNRGIYLDLNTRRSESVKISVEFIEKLLDSDINSIDDTIVSFYDIVVNSVKSKTQRSTTRYSFEDIKISLKDNIITVDCSSITNPQFSVLNEHISEWLTRMKNSNYYALGPFGNRGSEYYYEYDSTSNRRVLTFKNIKKVMK